MKVSSIENPFVELQRIAKIWSEIFLNKKEGIWGGKNEVLGNVTDKVKENKTARKDLGRKRERFGYKFFFEKEGSFLSEQIVNFQPPPPSQNSSNHPPG